MFCLIPLFSGSSGNAAYIGTKNEGILIDAGLPAVKICKALNSSGISPTALRGVLLTHSHSDHVRGLGSLLKKLPIPVFAASQTLDFIRCAKLLPTEHPAREVSGPFSLLNMEITPFETPHDAVPTLGFCFRLQDRTVGYATDLGTVTQTVREHLLGCDLVMIESNYEPALLSASPYPYILKRRIASSTGHLSNSDCADFICELAQSGTGRFVLAHLSRQNNSPDIARQTAESALQRLGLQSDRDYMLDVAEAFAPIRPVMF